MREFSRLIECFLDKLPSKCKKHFDVPNILWVLPTQHKNYADNTDREWFAQALQNAAKDREHNYILQLKQVWDQWDNSLFRQFDGRHTEVGLTTFWEAVDRTIRFCDASIDRKIAKKLEKTLISQRTYHNNQRSAIWNSNIRRRNQPEDFN